MIPWRHGPVLLIGTALTLGGGIPFYDGRAAIADYGLPARIADSGPAQVTMRIQGARTSALGLTLLLLYAAGRLEAADTCMLCIGLTALSDGYICWREGVRGRGVFRASFAAAVLAWGWFGMST